MKYLRSISRTMSINEKLIFICVAIFYQTQYGDIIMVNNMKKKAENISSNTSSLKLLNRRNVFSEVFEKEEAILKIFVSDIASPSGGSQWTWVISKSPTLRHSQ